MAQISGVNKDAGVRQDLVRLYTLGELGRFNGLRVKAVKEKGGDIPGMPNMAKLSMSQIVRLTRDLGLRIAGPAGTLHAYKNDEKAGLARIVGNPFVGGITEMACLRRHLLSTAALTRYSATSSVSACSVCPKSRITTV